MGGFFGVASKRDCLADVFFGTDYHSHLGTRRGGMAAYDETIGLQRVIHNIENTPFRTKFDHVLEDMQGTSAIGCISDLEPQPLLIRSHLGTYAICFVGAINNADELIEKCLADGFDHFDAMTGGAVNNTELIAALINQKKTFVEGIRYAQEQISGSASILILCNGGKLIAARDKVGRIPVLVGEAEDGYSVSFESFAYKKLGYKDVKELGPGEIVEITSDGVESVSAPGEKMRICAFLWSYYGYSTSDYEGVNVEVMRCRNGEIMAENDISTGLYNDIDYVGGVPDSG
ncbi:MAG: amidophosphoribosyltransferase, partial [Clostridia bacterium]|nr:amidophosphoribosyltransferase [Clostridia bacterium]